MMDNHLFYGEYEIIGHRALNESEFEFPISYGHRLDSIPNVFLQWGLIHLEKPRKTFDKYLKGENLNFPPGNPSRPVDNPFAYYGLGFSHRYDTNDIKIAIENNGQFDYDKSSYYRSQFDLRNPVNDHIRVDIFKAFGLKANASYDENRQLTKTIKTTDILKRLEND